MTESIVVTFPGGDGWHNRIEGADEVLNSHETRAEAVAAGRAYALDHGVLHIILNENGQLSERRDYIGDATLTTAGEVAE